MPEPPNPAAEPPLTAERVFREYAPRVYNLARRMLGNDADAEDVTQDVLLQIVRKLDTFRHDAALATWIHRVTVNAALAYRRKRAVRERGRVPEAEAEQPDAAELPGPVRRWARPPDLQLLDREIQRLVEGAIAGLPEPYRDVYVLADVEGLPNAEIGEALGLSLPAVKSRLHRARLLLRDALAPHFEGGIAS